MKRSAMRLAALVVLLAIVSSLTFPHTVNKAEAATRDEQALAGAAGRAAGRAVSHIVSRTVVRDTARYRWPACLAGARELRLHGLRHAIFMHECQKVL
jgi:hypothetical protein